MENNATRKRALRKKYAALHNRALHILGYDASIIAGLLHIRRARLRARELRRSASTRMCRGPLESKQAPEFEASSTQADFGLTFLPLHSKFTKPKHRGGSSAKRQGGASTAEKSPPTESKPTPEQLSQLKSPFEHILDQRKYAPESSSLQLEPVRRGKTSKRAADMASSVSSKKSRTNHTGENVQSQLKSPASTQTVSRVCANVSVLCFIIPCSS